MLRIGVSNSLVDIRACLQCQQLIPALNAWPQGRLPPNILDMDDFTTEHSFDLQAMWVIDVLGLFFAMVIIGVCTIRHRHTSG